jgi:hypothetical protein
MCYQLLAEKLTNYYRNHCLSGNHDEWLIKMLAMGRKVRES